MSWQRTYSGRKGGRVIGKCYYCRGPIHVGELSEVTDYAVSGHDGRPLRRRAHRGECAESLTNRMGGKP